MKIVILSCIWKREKVTKIFLKSIQRLKNDFKNDIDIKCIIIGSEKDYSKNLCKSEIYFEFNNFPISNKWLHGIEMSKKFNPDYILILGSDDLISNNLINKYFEYMKLGIDFIGIKDCYFIDLLSKKMFYCPSFIGKRINETRGIGRAISKRLLEKLDYKLWDINLNKGLDLSMTKKLINIEYSKKSLSLIENDIFAVDLKSEINIWNFMSQYNIESRFININETLIKYLPKDEIDLILNY